MADFAIGVQQAWTIHATPGDHVIAEVRDPTGFAQSLRPGDLLPSVHGGGHSLLVRRTLPGGFVLQIVSTGGQVAWRSGGGQQEYQLAYVVQ